MESKTIICTDIHGAGEELQGALEQVNFVYGFDKLILLGDLFDRGRHGHIVWQIIKKADAKSVVGNHERKFQKAFAKKDLGRLPPHYIWTLNNFVANGVNLEEFANFIDSLPRIITPTNSVILAHAGVNLDDPYKEDESANVYANLSGLEAMPIPQPSETDVYWWDYYKLTPINIKQPLVLYGHLSTHDKKARVSYREDGQISSIGLDTATVHGGPLTYYNIESKEIGQYKSGIDYFSGLKQEFRKNKPIPCKEVSEWLSLR